ncbi:diacylglycerol kinase [Zoogloea sp.]|uniref:diacylglycerol kinase n=1 Tax=Zoogloea sp. TaxID=49181 RepID=UPI002615D0C1|nr:diacylglycerol kinase [uncultured Zoogloea sp.]
MKGQGFLRRFGYARAGIVTAFRRERSMRTHGVAVIAAVVFLGLTRAPALWWALVGLAVGLVLVAEMANTAIETLADHLHPGQHPEIGVVKDVAAGAVLVASLVAVVVGLAYLATLLG